MAPSDEFTTERHCLSPPLHVDAPHCTSRVRGFDFFFELGRPVCYHVECAADTLSYSLKAHSIESQS